jgi:hypothetical protein
MNLSLKAAKELGDILARTLHGYTLPEQRGVVIDTKNSIASALPNSEQRIALDRSYCDTLDKLEPLQNGARWAY